MCLRETKPIRKTPGILSVIIFLQYWGTTRLDYRLSGISEGKENFAHHLIRLMCDTRDHLDESPQSIINNLCIYIS